MNGMAWCPTCREWTVLSVGKPCAWCDTILIRKRGGWKRPDLAARISPAAAQAIHHKYMAGVSARALGRQLYQVLGYKNARSCEIAIGDAFRRHHLPIRERTQATRLAVTTHGLSPRDHRERARRRRQAGLTITLEPPQPRCKGVRSQYPRKGEPCQRPAAKGSDYCVSHDPQRRAEVNAHLARLRQRLPQTAP